MHPHTSANCCTTYTLTFNTISAATSDVGSRTYFWTLVFLWCISLSFSAVGYFFHVCCRQKRNKRFHREHRARREKRLKNPKGDRIGQLFLMTSRWLIVCYCERFTVSWRYYEYMQRIIAEDTRLVLLACLGAEGANHVESVEILRCARWHDGSRVCGREEMWHDSWGDREMFRTGRCDRFVGEWPECRLLRREMGNVLICMRMRGECVSLVRRHVWALSLDVFVVKWLFSCIGQWESLIKRCGLVQHDGSIATCPPKCIVIHQQR